MSNSPLAMRCMPAQIRNKAPWHCQDGHHSGCKTISSFLSGFPGKDLDCGCIAKIKELLTSCFIACPTRPDYSINPIDGKVTIPLLGYQGNNLNYQCCLKSILLGSLMFYCRSCRTCGLVQLVQRPALRATAPAGCGPATERRQEKLTGEASCAEKANAALRVAPGTGADAAVSAARGAAVSTAKMRESWIVNPGRHRQWAMFK